MSDTNYQVPYILPGRSPELTNRTLIKSASPFTSFEYVDVTFMAADTDYDVVHTLNPLNPELIDYQVVRADRSTNIYHNYSGNRRVWGTGYITVRSTAASAQVTLLLTIRR